MELKLSNYCRRYTELPFLIDFLTTKELALLNPALWDDRNDAFYLDLYARKAGLKSTRALCLTQASETYHHWKIFSSGPSGVCVEFYKEKLLAHAKKTPDLRAESVKYRKIADLRSMSPELEELPFLKRYAFQDEHEFRLFVVQQSEEAGPVRIKMPLSTISRVVLSPWLPKSAADNVKKAIASIKGCKSLSVFRSTLVENEQWKSAASRVHGILAGPAD
jgi:hypothetical protein